MLVKNSSANCSLVAVPVRYVLSLHVDDADYLYYPNRSAATVRCPPDPADQVLVQSRLHVPLSCNIVSGDVRRTGMHTHNVGVFSRRLQLFPLLPFSSQTDRRSRLLLSPTWIQSSLMTRLAQFLGIFLMQLMVR